MSETTANRPGDRWCRACGGETRHVRRYRSPHIITYRQCLLCGGLVETMRYHCETRQTTEGAYAGPPHAA